MYKQPFSQQLKERLEKIEVSNTISNTKEFTQKEFEKEAKDVKATFEDEDLPQPHSYR